MNSKTPGFIKRSFILDPNRSVSKSGGGETLSTNDLELKKLVTVALQEIKINQLKLIDEHLNAEIQLEMTWYDPDIKLTNIPSAKKLSRMWNPDIYVLNSFGRIRSNSFFYTLIKENQVYVVEEKRFVGNFIMDPNWTKFPFDIQMLTFFVDSNLGLLQTVNNPNGAKDVLICKFDNREFLVYDFIKVYNDIKDNLIIKIMFAMQRSPWLYIPWFLLDFTFGLLALIPFTFPFMQWDIRLLLETVVILCIIISERANSHLLPHTLKLTLLDKYHLMVLIFVLSAYLLNGFAGLLMQTLTWSDETIVNVKQYFWIIFMVYWVIFVTINTGFFFFVYFDFKERQVTYLIKEENSGA